MSMEHGPPSITPGVENKPVPTGRNPFGLSHGSPSNEHLSKHVRRGGSQLKRVLVVIRGNHQNVRSRLSIDVPKRQSPLSAMHHSGRNLPTHDPTKQTRVHSTHSQRLIHRQVRQASGREPANEQSAAQAAKSEAQPTEGKAYWRNPPHKATNHSNPRATTTQQGRNPTGH
jgi:hypothetical protein